jgi:uncharacterized membrane protein YfhO
MSGKFAFWLSFSLVLAIATYIFWDFITLNKLYLFKDIGSDTVNQFYPRLVHAARYLREEGLPGWSFHHGMGQNFFPGGLNNPFNLFLYGLGPEKLAWGLGWVEWFKFVLAGLIFHAYLKCLNVGPWTRVIGTLLLTFSGFFILGSGWWGHSYRVLLAALLLLSIERYLGKKNWYLFPLAIALMAGPQLYFYAIFAAIYVVFRFMEENFDLKSAVHYTIALTGYALLGILISSVWFAPLAIAILESPRVAGEAGLSSALSSRAVFGLETPLHYWTVVYRLFSNDAIGTGSLFRGWNNYLEAPAFYCGTLSILLFSRVFCEPGRKKWIYLGFISIWVFPVIFPWFRYAYSLFVGDYYKTGLSFIVPFAATYLAIRALDTLGKNRAGSDWIMIATAILLLVALYWPNDVLKLSDNIKMLVTTMLLLQAFTVFWVSRYSRPWVLMAVLAGLACFEAGWMGHITPNNRSTITAEEFNSKTGYKDMTLEALNFIKERESGFYRVHKSYSSGPAIHKSLNDALIQDFFSSPSYLSFNQGNYIKFLAAMDIVDPSDEVQTRWAIGATKRWALQSVIGSKYQLIRSRPNTRVNLVLEKTYDKLKTFGDITVYENKAFIPFASTFEKVAFRSAFDPLPPVAKDMALLYAAIVEDEDMALVGQMTQASTAELNLPISIENYLDLSRQLATRNPVDISHFSANNIEGSISVDKTVIVFFPMPFDSNWSARVNGEQKKMIQIQAGLSGLILPPGDHQISLSYTPPYLLYGLIGTALGVILFIWLAFRHRRLEINLTSHPLTNP